MKAKGLLLVILSNAPEWRVYPDELAKRSKDGVNTVKTTLKELEEAGYVRTYVRSMGRGKGIQRFRFCADRKIGDKIFNDLKNQLEKEISS
ncbi:helix-turn-helix domain-containing protein [Streptococcus hyointestinalis]|nr:helix-turn-helix domain-containing protein [Streptococcus hyointestinalis]MDD6383983.1 helix-turn-helix domain-containing protein [Streptococcus hyointestinalis]